MAERTDISGVGPEYNETISGRIKRTSWGAIFAGAFASLLAWLILMMLGASIGANALAPSASTGTGANGGGGGGVGVLPIIFFIIAGLISFFFGGWISGLLSGALRRVDGGLHGLISMSVATIFMFVALSTTVGSLLGGVFGLVGNTISGAGQAVAGQPGMLQRLGNQARQSGPVQAQSALNDIKQQAHAMMQQKGVTSSDVQSRLDNSLDNLFSQGGNPPRSSREDVIAILTQDGKMSRSEAESQVDGWVQNYQSLAGNQAPPGPNVEQQAKQVARQAAGIASGLAFGTFLMLLLSAIAAYFGGIVGNQTEDKYLTYPRPRGRVRVREREEIRRRPVEEVQP